MPLLEAPQDLSESSPEISLNQEVPEQAQAAIPILPIAAAQIRLPTPEPLQQVNNQVLERNIRNRDRNRVQGSYDLDILEAEEENHFPAYVHLLPVVLPVQSPEPTLDELLVSFRKKFFIFDLQFIDL